MDSFSPPGFNDQISYLSTVTLYTHRRGLIVAIAAAIGVYNGVVGVDTDDLSSSGDAVSDAEQHSMGESVTRDELTATPRNHKASGDVLGTRLTSTGSKPYFWALAPARSIAEVPLGGSPNGDPSDTTHRCAIVGVRGSSCRIHRRHVQGFRTHSQAGSTTPLPKSTRALTSNI